MVAKPKFADSPYFVDEPNNWHLKDGAPNDVREEFEEFMREQEEANKNGVYL